MTLMVGLRLLELLLIKGRARHLEENGADAVDSTHVVRVDVQDFLEFGDGLIPACLILGRRSAGDVLARVSCCKIQPRIHQGGIRFLGLLEMLDSRIILPILEVSDTFVQLITRFELATARDTAREDQQRHQGQSPASDPT